MANKDPKPISDKSEWLDKPRDGFTEAMRELFVGKQQPEPLDNVGPGKPWQKPKRIISESDREVA